MAKMKIFELKNEINQITKGNLESKDILDFLDKSFGVKKTHSSSLEDNEVAYVKNYYVQLSRTAKEAPASAAKPVHPAASKPSPETRQDTPQRTEAPHKAAAPSAAQAHPAGQKPAGAMSGGQQTGTKPAGQNPTAYSTASHNSSAQGNAVQSPARSAAEQSHQEANRPAEPSNAARPGQIGAAGSNSINQRPASGQGGARSGQFTGQNREQRTNEQGHQGTHTMQGTQSTHGTQGTQGTHGTQGQRPAGGQGVMRQGQQGNTANQRPAGRTSYDNNAQGQRPQNRPYGDNNQGQRQQRPYEGRPAGEGYQGQRQQRPYEGRPAGEGYQGQRPQRPYEGRPAGEGQGNRYQGGARPQTGAGQSSRGGYGGQGGYSRPGNGPKPGGGFNSRGFENSGKDDDDKPVFNRGQGNKKGTGRAGGERKNFDQQILDQKVAEKNDNSNKRNRDRINKEKNYKEKSLVDRENETVENKSKIAPKKGQFIQPKPIQVVEEEIKVITIPEVLTIKELAEKMKRPSAALIKKLFLAGKIVTLNQEITFEEAEEIALGYEIIAEKEVKINVIEELLKEQEEDPATMVKRPPVVCVMGHVDHGKTSLLDAVRETNVTSREAGGITQHIGAYVVEINGEKITFLDTPGHEAFTSMRKRGAKSTDIAILVVAADDGVMPQTIEAINHAKAAGVQIIVAINKIDKPSANIERVKQELTEYELIAEDWGGDTIFVPVSAHTKEGIDQLLEMILLTAELVELKANPNRNARGIVIEAELDKGRGPVATILVQKGTLHVGDNVAVGASFGKVRAMIDDKGRRVKEATPSTPVEILGLNEVPDAGETFMATDNEKEARNIAETYLAQSKEKLIADTKAKLSLDGLFSQIQAGNIKELNLIIKADVQGSVEAMKQSLLKLSNAEVAIRVIHGGVGAINESDVMLASTSNAIIIGFNVRPENAAKDTADRENVEVKLYRVIYDAINDIEAAMKGMLDPVFEERIIGHAEIRMTFKASGIGTIAGSYVLDGKIIRNCKARIFRDNTMIYEGTLASLKRFQDDVKEVATGYECGLVFEKFNDVKEGDKVEVYIMAEVPR